MKNEGVPFISALTLLVSARVSVLNPFLRKPLLRAQMELEAEVGIEPWPKICRSNLKLHCNFESTTFETTALTLYKLKLFLDISMAYEVFAPHNDQFPTLLPGFPLYCAVSDFIVFLHLSALRPFAPSFSGTCPFSSSFAESGRTC